MQRISSLTSLRFFAAISVLLFHFPIHFPGHLGKAYGLLSAHGYTGVTFFFILSGFLLSTIYSEKSLNSKLSLVTFFGKRLIRIVPTYWLALLLTSFFLDGTLRVAKSQGHLFERLGDVGLHISLLQAWIPMSPFRLHWNEPTWSVSVEVFYYLLFPVILILIRKTKSSISRICIWFVITSTVHGLIYLIRGGNWNQTPTGTFRDILSLPFSSLTVFLFGMLGGLLVKELTKLRIDPILWKIVFWFGCALVVLFAIIDQETNPFAQVILCTGMTLVVSSASQITGCIQQFLSLPLLLILGEASYALYLIQRPVDEWLKFIWKHPPSTNIYHATVIIVSLLASVAIWYWFERPVGRWLTRKYIKNP